MKTQWRTKPISRTCEQRLAPDCKRACGKPTTFAYEAYGGGWMALCDGHVGVHGEYVKPIKKLLAFGETFADA